MKTSDLSVERDSRVPAVQWQWTNFRVSLLCLWAFLLGANLVQVGGALSAHERWWGPGLGAIVSAGSIALILHAARSRRGREA